MVILKHYLKYIFLLLLPEILMIVGIVFISSTYIIPQFEMGVSLLLGIILTLPAVKYAEFIMKKYFLD